MGRARRINIFLCIFSRKIAAKKYTCGGARPLRGGMGGAGGGGIFDFVVKDNWPRAGWVLVMSGCLNLRINGQGRGKSKLPGEHRQGVRVSIYAWQDQHAVA